MTMPPVLNFTPLQLLNHILFEQAKIQVWVKRDDLTDSAIQGNKWRKLAPNIAAMQQTDKSQLLTFGGAYSNHIAATAAAGKRFGFKAVGIIRGEELAEQPDRWSHTLRRAAENGMQLQFISRKAYRQRHDPTFLHTLQQQYPRAYILPEGGSNNLAVQGMAEVIKQLNQQCPNWTHLYTAVGTGASFSGLVKATESTAQTPKQVHGVAVLNQADHLLPQIQNWIDTTQTVHWQLHTQSACGGYGKTTPTLLETLTWFEQAFDIPLEQVYTAKMVHHFLKAVKSGQIPKGSQVVLYHSGGLQGRKA